MRFFSYFADARKTIMSNKMRSALSTLGIVIGMASVIIMMSIGQGAEAEIMKSMSDLMKNKISISAGGGFSRWDEKTKSPGQYVKKISFTTEIISYIEKYFPELQGRITYQVSSDGGDLKIGTKSDYVSAMGVPTSRFKLYEKKIAEGVRFTKENYKKLSFVAIVNDKFKETFFKNKPILGKKFMLNKKEYTVVGVLKKGDLERGSQVYLPDTTVSERLKHSKEIQDFEIFLDPQADNALWKKRITYLLLKKFNQPNKSVAGFNVNSSADMAKEIKKSSNMFKYLLLAIGAISLLVGGIGVMNIMIVSVTERTREIGIRKAIGALNGDIVMQFLIESVVITLIGGLIALLLSYGAVFFINKALAGTMKAIIDFKVVSLSFLLTSFTGVVFGILPARKAAQLKPIDALRFE